MTDEVFKVIEDCPNYMISSHGRVMNIKRGKFMALGTKKAGYKQVGLTVGGKRVWFLVHRLVAQAFIPNPEGKPEVNHKDEDKANNFDWNLEWMTEQENTEYSQAHNYWLISPEGEHIEVWNLCKFCRTHGLQQGNMTNVISGNAKSHKGWRLGSKPL
ncbi:HNH endonuclease [Vibrio phage D530]